QRVRALGRQPPESGAEIFAAGALQIIRVRDPHQIGRPPEEVFRLDEMVTFNGFHEMVGGHLAPVKETSLRLRFLTCADLFEYWPAISAQNYRHEKAFRPFAPFAPVAA